MIEWNPVAQDRQARKAAQEAEEARREAACTSCGSYPALPDGDFCAACRAAIEDGAMEADAFMGNYGGTD